jgi:Protein of unknown function (DUF2752)
MRTGSARFFEDGLWILCAAALVFSFALPLRALPHLTLCWFYSFTHIPCPACGLTRAFLCISHGDWRQAFIFNPFGFVWYLLIIYGFLRPLLLRNAPRLFAPVEKMLAANFFFPILVGLMFAVWIWRLKSGTLIG